MTMPPVVSTPLSLLLVFLIPMAVLSATTIAYMVGGIWGVLFGVRVFVTRDPDRRHTRLVAALSMFWIGLLALPTVPGFIAMQDSFAHVILAAGVITGTLFVGADLRREYCVGWVRSVLVMLVALISAAAAGCAVGWVGFKAIESAFGMMFSLPTGMFEAI